MELDKQYSIQFSGLKVGKHYFEYDLNDSFFIPFLLEDEEGYQVSLKVNLELEKLSTMLILNFSLKGKWYTECDRCGDDLTVKLTSENQLFVKFGDTESESEDVLTLGHNDFEMNVSPFIYEYFLTCLPSRNTHKKGECNEEVLKKLKELAPKEQGNNPMWDKLKDLN